MSNESIICVIAFLGVTCYLIVSSKRHSSKLTQKAMLEATNEFPKHTRLAARVFICFAENFGLDYTCVSFNSSLWDDFGFGKHPAIVSDLADVISDALDREVDETIATGCITLRHLVEVAISIEQQSEQLAAR